MALNIRKGDLVQVISGKDRGVKGKVISGKGTRECRYDFCEREG